MRNFEERMAEIKSRSRARIIRRRKQAASVCASLAVVLCLGGTHLLQQQTVYKQEGVPTATTTLPAYAGSITVIDGQTKYVYNNEETVTQFQTLMDDLLRNQNSPTDANQVYTDHSIKITSAPVRYTIVLEDEAGEKIEYTLQGKMLIRKDIHEEYILTDSHRLQLLELLSLSKN